MPGIHERLGFSGNWIHCAAAPNRCEGLPDSTSYSADWGTMSHTLLEKALMEGICPVVHHRAVQDMMAPFTSEAGFPYSVQDQLEQAEAAKFAFDYAQKRWQEMGKDALLIPEQKVFIRSTGRSDLGGTADITIYNDQEIEIIDYKSGIGIFVAPDVPQLKLCALGVLETLPGISLGTPVKLTIVQPRYPSGEAVRSIDTTVSELMNYLEFTVALRADMTDNPDVLGEPGEKACRFCAARKTEFINGFHQSRCVEYDQAIVESVSGMFSPIQDIEPSMIHKHQENVVYDNKALSKILLLLPVIRNYCDDLEEHAIDVIKKGEKVPLQKVIATTGKKKWLDIDAVDDALNRTAIKKTSYKSTLMTPKQIMDQEMSKGLRKKLEGLIGMGSGGVKLVHQDDPHDSIIPDFQPITDQGAVPESFKPITENTAVEDLPAFLQ